MNTFKDDPRFYNAERTFKSEKYDSERFIQGLIDRAGLKNDAGLSRLLGMTPPQISKVRNKRLPVTPAFLVRVHEAMGIPIHELRAMLGD